MTRSRRRRLTERRIRLKYDLGAWLEMSPRDLGTFKEKKDSVVRLLRRIHRIERITNSDTITNIKDKE